MHLDLDAFHVDGLILLELAGVLFVVLEERLVDDRDADAASVDSLLM